jgi:hypothetical protein
MQYFGISRFALGVVYACIPLRWYFPDNTEVSGLCATNSATT